MRSLCSEPVLLGSPSAKLIVVAVYSGNNSESPSRLGCTTAATVVAFVNADIFANPSYILTRRPTSVETKRSALAVSVTVPVRALDVMVVSVVFSSRNGPNSNGTSVNVQAVSEVRVNFLGAWLG